ncbi:MAG TPA: GNAT family N-acetyltransferase [Savagea sp.]
MQLIEWSSEEVEQLIHFMTTNTWPFHVEENPERQLIEKTIEEGSYESDDVKTFWVIDEEQNKVGIVKLYDLLDEIPIFDLRIADEQRGKGYGPVALSLLTDYVFHLPDEKIRLEGHTRQDNLAMRKTFERAGFVKEAHLRNAWLSPKENRYYDAVTYGMTRQDYFEKKTTPVAWEDRGVGGTRIPTYFPEQFESERLIIRAPRIDDVDAVWQATVRSQESFKEWFPWAQQAPARSETEKSIRKAIADFTTREDLRLHIFSKETGELVGSSGLHRIDWSIPKFEIGYWLDSHHTGKGYMTEAVERITQFAFEQLFARRVEIRCEENNWRSRKIAERLQFELEGILKQDSLSADGSHLRNTCIYAKIE